MQATKVRLKKVAVQAQPNQPTVMGPVCPYGRSDHKDHDELIRVLKSGVETAVKRTQQLQGIIKASNAQSTRLRAELTALKVSLKEGPDRTTKILAASLLALEAEVAHLKAGKL